MAIIGIYFSTTNNFTPNFIGGETVFLPNQFREYLKPNIVSVREQGQVLEGKMGWCEK